MARPFCYNKEIEDTGRSGLLLNCLIFHYIHCAWKMFKVEQRTPILLLRVEFSLHLYVLLLNYCYAQNSKMALPITICSLLDFPVYTLQKQNLIYHNSFVILVAKSEGHHCTAYKTIIYRFSHTCTL